jgi:hypothetical protein
VRGIDVTLYNVLSHKVAATPQAQSEEELDGEADRERRRQGEKGNNSNIRLLVSLPPPLLVFTSSVFRLCACGVAAVLTPIRATRSLQWHRACY